MNQQFHTTHLVKSNEKNQITLMHLPYDTPLKLLPAYYLLPLDLISKSKRCCDIPRSPLEALGSDHYRQIIFSTEFLHLMMEAISFLVWPHIGIYTRKEAFSMDDPIYRWTYAMPHFIRCLSEISDYNLQFLFSQPKTFQYPYRTMEDVNIIMHTTVERAMEQHGMREVIEIVKQNRCDEDYASTNSAAKIDFLRKRYHTRNFASRMETSLDELIDGTMERPTTREQSIAGTYSIEDQVIADVLVADFMKQLTSRDMEILKLRNEGYTYQEIADDLGYKTHSAIKKRIDRLAEQWLAYNQEHI